jgi:hypothetical protein
MPKFVFLLQLGSLPKLFQTLETNINRMLMCTYVSPQALQLVQNLSKETWKITKDEESMK